jgi:agmatine deiminase
MTWRMPAEWAPHERTLMCWPARGELWGEHFAQAESDYAEVANTIAAFEPVLMSAHPSQVADARAACSEAVAVVSIPVDDSWARDSGPIFVVSDGRRRGVDFGFNAWGEKFHPYAEDVEYARRVLAHLGEERRDARDLVLEGGSIAVDGEGTLITTEQCLLHPSRNPSLDRSEIEARLMEELGIGRVIWLARGLLEDTDTDGHVDNVCAVVSPGRVLLQTVSDPANPNHERGAENAERLRAEGIEVVELELLPYAAPDTVVPYVNYYVCNGAVVVPVSDPETDDEALSRLRGLYPDREVVGVPGRTLAHGGGGVHCITQQVPAV